MENHGGKSRHKGKALPSADATDMLAAIGGCCDIVLELEGLLTQLSPRAQKESLGIVNKIETV